MNPYVFHFWLPYKIIFFLIFGIKCNFDQNVIQIYFLVYFKLDWEEFFYIKLVSKIRQLIIKDPNDLTLQIGLLSYSTVTDTTHSPSLPLSSWASISIPTETINYIELHIIPYNPGIMSDINTIQEKYILNHLLRIKMI